MDYNSGLMPFEVADQLPGHLDPSVPVNFEEPQTIFPMSFIHGHPAASVPIACQTLPNQSLARLYGPSN